MSDRAVATEWAPSITGANGAHARVAANDGAVGRASDERPPRIAILGWARLAAQAREGSGYNLNASELARGLVLAGHSVVYLSSGMTYRLSFGTLVGRPRVDIAHREDWDGVRCFEVRNSPIASPAAHNFGNLGPEFSCPQVTRLVLRFLEKQRVDIVHIHALEGYPLDVVAAIESAGRRVVVTTHNYHYACPQVDLFHREREVCVDYDSGRKCEHCLPCKDVRRLRLSRAVGQTLERRIGMYPADVVRKFVYGLPGFAKRLVRRRAPHAADNAGDIGHPTTDIPPYSRSPADQNERVLANPTHLTVLNDFARRRIAGLEALKAATLVTAPSEYVRRVYVAMGVPEARTRWVRLGQPHFDEINRRARASPYYNQRPWDPRAATRPLRFAYFGTTRPNKGVEVLARAIPLVDPVLRARAQFSIHASGEDASLRRRLREFPNVTVRPGYDLAQLAASGGEYDIGILTHVWLENSPLVLLEHLHAGKFVLAPRLGGVVDFVTEPDALRGVPGNGLTFAGGDEAGLARAIERLISGEVPVPSAREVHQAKALRSYAEHILEISTIYRALVAGSEIVARRAQAVGSAG